MTEEEKKKKEDPKVRIGDKSFPEKPGLTDYVSEAFQPTNVRANLDAVRKARARYR
jgi:hypothetical protein